MKKDLYTVLGWIAMLSVPLAPAFFFGFSFAKDIYTQVLDLTGVIGVAAAFAVAVGVVSAAGLELVGILSGHNAVRFWEMGNKVHAGLCGVILVSYVILGISGLESVLAKGTVMFLVAPLVYLLVGMQGELNRAESQQIVKERQSLAIELRREEAAAQRQHELELEKLRLDADVKKERARQPKVVATLPQPSTIGGQPVNHASTVDELTPGQLRVYEIMRENPDLSQADIAKKLEISRQAVGKHVKVINGLAKRPQLIGGNDHA